MKIIGNTVGMGLPKPNLMQTDPTKGDYIRGKEEFLQQIKTGTSYAIIEETTVESNEFVRGFGTADFTDGKGIAVIVDGVLYLVHLTTVGEGIDAWAYIGNLATGVPEAVGTELDTGEPFAGVVYSSFTTFIFADGQPHKVAVYKLNELDEAIANDMNKAFAIHSTETGLDKTNKEIYEAFLQNRPIYGVYRVVPGKFIIFHPVWVRENEAHFVSYADNNIIFVTYIDGEVITEQVEIGGFGIPQGGKKGQYLCKQSDDDYDVVWCDMVIPEQYGLVTYDQDKTITIT